MVNNYEISKNVDILAASTLTVENSHSHKRPGNISQVPNDIFIH